MTSKKTDQRTKTDPTADVATSDLSPDSHLGIDGVDSEVETDAEGSLVQNAELESLQHQLSDLKEQHLRARAEVENIRKRSDAEVANIRKYALEGFVRELLMVKDSLEMAQHVDFDSKTTDKEILENMVEGINLTVKQLETVFDRFAIQEVLPELGDKLDPELHQAMGMEETANFKVNEICKVVQKGYSLNGRLLRPAMVMVAREVQDA